VLLSLPPSTVISPIPGVSISTGSLSVGSNTLPDKFSAPGLDLGYLSSDASAGITATYQ
jgi:hypothetical protein